MFIEVGGVCLCVHCPHTRRNMTLYHASRYIWPSHTPTAATTSFAARKCVARCTSKKPALREPEIHPFSSESSLSMSWQSYVDDHMCVLEPFAFPFKILPMKCDDLSGSLPKTCVRAQFSDLLEEVHFRSRFSL
jgi:hypothetical protein